MLQLLSKCTPKQRRALIDAADDDLVKTICECAINVFNSNIPLPQRQLNKFKRYKKVLRQLCTKCVSLKTKKNLLKQRGGFLPFLIPPILSLIGGLAGRAIGKAAGL